MSTGSGKGERQNTIRRRVGLAENVGDPKGKNLRFARAGPGHHHHRTLDRVHRRLLRQVKRAVILLEFTCPERRRGVHFRHLTYYNTYKIEVSNVLICVRP